MEKHEFLQRMADDVAAIEARGEHDDMDRASFGYECGVLLTGNEAKLVLSMLGFPRAGAIDPVATLKADSSADLAFFHDNFSQFNVSAWRCNSVPELILSHTRSGTWDLDIESDNGAKSVCIHKEFYIAIYYAKKHLESHGK